MLRTLILCLLLCIINNLLQAQTKLLASYNVPKAQQAVAVGKDHFYVINNSSITKHLKSDGSIVQVWDATDLGSIKHLNSGVIIGDSLYCSHSNFPESPMASSVEIFDINTLEHISSHSFGIMIGSATWIDQFNGDWYVAFAHYAGNGSSMGKGPEWTQLVRFDNKWQRQQAWIFPKEVIEKFSPYSTSGGVWTDNGKLYVTGHDKKEIYVMALPEMGHTLKLTRIISVPIPGQGIAWDHWEENVLWGIDRKRSVILKVGME